MKKALDEALKDRGYTKLTPVQEAVLDPDLAGCDLLVSAQTGSGKTLAFGLTIAPTLLQTAERFDQADAPLGLIVAPTRELAMQVKRELSWLFEKTGAVLASCVGGMDMRDERRALARGAHIVVATPGRLRDHITRGTIDLGQVRAVVLDEADEMLDLGFREDLEFILSQAPDERQTLLFSATVSGAIAKLAQNYQQDAKRVVARSETRQHADITYEAYDVAERDTENAVINTLLFHRAPNAIVFGNTRATVNRLTTRLSNRGFRVVSLSGELSQSERTHALQAMRDGRAQVCVATDVAARGIDLPNLDLVVHAELPSNHETLLHRSGRTGRAGRKGVSALIVTRKVRKKAERILKMAKLQIEWTEAPSAEAVREREQERLLADPVWESDLTSVDQDLIEQLQSRFSPEKLAAAYVNLYMSVRSAPEELSKPDAKPAPRQNFGPGVWFSVSGGRAAGAEPRRLLPMLCKAGDLTRDDIGAIRVRDTQSFVQIKTEKVQAFLSAIGSEMTVEAGAVLTQLDAAPDLGEERRPGPSGPRKPGGGPRPRGKPPAHPRGDKPERKPRDDRNKDDRYSAPRRDDAPKPARDEAAGQGAPRRRAAPGDGPGAPRNKPKGPPPPKGKPSSKKNRARALAAKTAAKPKGKPARGRPGKPGRP